jgi:hypothetical protein
VVAVIRLPAKNPPAALVPAVMTGDEVVGLAGKLLDAFDLWS